MHDKALRTEGFFLAAEGEHCRQFTGITAAIDLHQRASCQLANTLNDASFINV